MAEIQGFFPTDDPEQMQLAQRQAMAQQILQRGMQAPGNSPGAGLASLGNSLAGALLAKRLGDKARGLEQTRESNYATALGNLLAPSNAQMNVGGGVSTTGGGLVPGAGGGVSNDPGQGYVAPQASGSGLDAQGQPAPVNVTPQVGANVAQRLQVSGNPDLMRQLAPQLLAQQLQGQAPITPYQQAEMARQREIDARPTFRAPGEVPIDPNTGKALGDPIGGTGTPLTAAELAQNNLPPGTSAYWKPGSKIPEIINKPPVPEPPKSPERRAQDVADAAQRDQARINAQLNQGGAPGSTPPGLTGKPEIDPSAPGYGSHTIGNTGLTQASLDQKALNYITSGTLPPQGRTGIAGMQNAAISNRMAEMDPGGNLASNKANVKALSGSLAGQQKYLDNTQAALNTANDTLSSLQTWMEKNNVNPTQFPDANSFLNWMKSKGIDPGQAGGYNAQLATLRAEYSNVLAKGGVRSVDTDREAAKLIPAGLAPADLAKVAERIQTDGVNVVRDRQNQVKQISDQIWHPGGKAAPSIASPTPGAPQGQVPAAAPAAVTKRVKFDLRGNIIP